LFGLSPDQIEVIIHPQSIVHSMVAYRDGSILAQLGPSDMRGAIGYALSHPARNHLPVERLDFAKLSKLEFEAPDETRFPALRLAREVMQAGGLSGAIFNGAKEAALEAFIAGKIPFLKMAEIVERVVTQMPVSKAYDIADVYQADQNARTLANASIAAI
jgi:1-deoxy-D-xylulose-5-phosphate reductoisomerase